MTSIFAYILHRDGVIDDSAVELAAAARKLNPAVSPIAIVVGSGAELDGACESARARFSEVWKIANEAFSYPNAELIRQALAKVLPAGSIFLAPHDQFGIDLCPGLSIKLNAAYLADVVGLEKVVASSLTAVRQEFGGQVSTHVTCDISTGVVITIRGGAFKAVDEAPLAGTVVDKSAGIGTLTARRRYLKTVLAEAGDVDITKHAILVSVGRGIQEKDNVGIAHCRQIVGANRDAQLFPQGTRPVFVLYRGESRLGREQAFLQQRLEQNSAHLARAQHGHSFSREIETHRAVSSVYFRVGYCTFHEARAVSSQGDRERRVASPGKRTHVRMKIPLLR